MHRRIPFLITLLTVVLLVVSAGCSSTLTSDEQAYLDRAMEHPTIFTMLKTDRFTAWKRAAAWINTYSVEPLDEVKDDVLRTKPAGSGTDFETSYGYEVTRKPVGDDRIEVAVSCSVSNMFYGEQAKTNAHLLAYYIGTGDLPSPNVVNR